MADRLAEHPGHNAPQGRRRASTPLPARKWLLVGALLLALAALLAACGGGDSNNSDHIVLTPVSSQYLPIVISSDIAIGPNRFSLGLIDQKQNAPVVGAQLHLRFLLMNGQQATLKSEADPTPLTITKTYTHTHQDGKVETHPAGQTGAYVTNANFDTAATWGVEVSGAANGQAIDPVRLVFSVNQKSASPAIGDPAPRSVQQTLKDVSDIGQIDTSETPIADEHNMTIAEAVTSGKPTVIVFATPAFCTSQVCGPTKQTVDDLYARYKGQANFVHVEPYDLAKARAGTALEPLPFITDEWHFESEPWTFIVDSQGKIAGKFDGIVTFDELEQSLKPLLGLGG